MRPIHKRVIPVRNNQYEINRNKYRKYAGEGNKKITEAILSEQQSMIY